MHMLYASLSSSTINTRRNTRDIRAACLALVAARLQLDNAVREIPAHFRILGRYEHVLLPTNA